MYFLHSLGSGHFNDVGYSKKENECTNKLYNLYKPPSCNGGGWLKKKIKEKRVESSHMYVSEKHPETVLQAHYKYIESFSLCKLVP